MLGGWHMQFAAADLLAGGVDKDGFHNHAVCAFVRWLHQEDVVVVQGINDSLNASGQVCVAAAECRVGVGLERWAKLFLSLYQS
jgi:hypothetical protein